MYFGCDWKFRTDIDLNLIIETTQRLQCEVSLVEAYESERGDFVYKVGVKLPSQTDLQKLIEIIGKPYGAEIWYPISEELFMRGRVISLKPLDALKVIERFEKLKTYAHESDEFFRKLSNEWRDYAIFTAHWIIDSQGIDTVDDLFKIAKSLDTQLMFRKHKNGEGYSIIRFVLPVPSETILAEFMQKVSDLLPLKEWLQTSLADLPNFLSPPPDTFPQGGYTLWKEGLINAAGDNSRRKKRSSDE